MVGLVQILLTIGIFLFCCILVFAMMRLYVRISFFSRDVRLTGLIPLAIYIIFIAIALVFNLSPALDKLLIFVLAVFSTSHYIIIIFSDISNSEKGILHVLLKIGFSAIFACILFGLIYFSAYIFIGEQVFISSNLGDSVFDKLVSFMYFSFVSFGTVGYGDIVPATSLTKILVIFESILSFVVTVYAFSSFMIIRDTVANFKNNKTNSDEDNK